MKDEEAEMKSEESFRIPRDGGDFIGFERAGVAYHREDVVLISPGTFEPCQIGKIMSIVEGDGLFSLEVQLFGRVNDLIRSTEN